MNNANANAITHVLLTFFRILDLSRPYSDLQSYDLVLHPYGPIPAQPVLSAPRIHGAITCPLA